MSILFGILIFWLGVFVGCLIVWWFTNRGREYSGTIVVAMDPRREKTVYSLVLDDYPEKLEFKKEVIFKVNTSDQSSDRT